MVEAISYDDTKVAYSYNDKKQLSKVTYEDGRTKSYAYNSNLESITDINGVISKTFEYESDGKAKATAKK